MSRRITEQEDYPANGRQFPEGTAGTDLPPWETGSADPADETGDNPELSEEGAEPEEENKPSVLREWFVGLLSGNFLFRSEVRRAYPYIIFLAVLAFLYIMNVFHSQFLYREHMRLTEEVKELRSKSMTIASRRMITTRQSNIMEELERRNIPLRESLKPNKIIPADDGI